MSPLNPQRGAWFFRVLSGPNYSEIFSEYFTNKDNGNIRAAKVMTAHKKTHLSQYLLRGQTLYFFGGTTYADTVPALKRSLQKSPVQATAETARTEWTSLICRGLCYCHHKTDIY
jgi:hypothetical protein